MLYVVLPVFNGWSSTKEFLNCCSSQTYKQFEIVICDDGSTDRTSERIACEYPYVTVLSGNGNLWWTGGINCCLKYVLQNANDDDYILTINNDVRFDSDYLHRKIVMARTYPNAVIGSVCVFMDAPNRIETSGFLVDHRWCITRSLTKRGEYIKKWKEYQLYVVDYLPGKGVCYSVRLLRSIGFYDEVGFPQYHADSDFVLRAKKSGYDVYVDFGAVVYSDVNLKNMTVISDEMSFNRIIQTFTNKYRPNYPEVIVRFGQKHMGNRWVQYVIFTYIRIVSGMIRRYFTKLVLGKRSYYLS